MSDDLFSISLPGASRRRDASLLREVSHRLGRAAMLRRSRLGDPERGHARDPRRFPGGAHRTSGSVRRIDAGDKGRATLIRHGAYLVQHGRGGGRTYRGLEASLGADERIDYDRARDERSAAPFYDSTREGLSLREALTPFTGEAAHYRVTLSASAGWDLGDLRPMIRSTLGAFELSIGARLDWVGIDHHDTPHPHTHLVISAMTGGDRDIGLSETSLRRRLQRAAEIALVGAFGSVRSREAGHMTSGGERLALDAELVSRARSGEDFVCDQADLLMRLEALEARSLARRAPEGRWRLPADLSLRLAEMSLREDLETGARVLVGDAPPPLLAAAPHVRHVGLFRGAIDPDPFSDRHSLILEAGDGELRWISARVDETPVFLAAGGLVAFDRLSADPRVEALSLLSLEDQVSAGHLTYLDRAIAGHVPAITGGGRAADQFRQALEKRRLTLQTRGWIRPGETVPGQRALLDLAQREKAVWTARLQQLHPTSGVDRQPHRAPARLSLVQGEFDILSDAHQQVVLISTSHRARGRSHVE